MSKSERDKNTGCKWAESLILKPECALMTKPKRVAGIPV